MPTKVWGVEVTIEEHDDVRTKASARLRTGEEDHLTGVGFARRNPADSAVPAIGDELAAARALADLAHQLLEASAADIENVTHRAAHIVS